MYFGRYWVIRASLWLMWIGALFFGTNLCINSLVSPHYEGVQLAVNVVLLPVALLAMEVARSYHRRERGETKRQQDYTEEYYSKYLRTRHR